MHQIGSGPSLASHLLNATIKRHLNFHYRKFRRDAFFICSIFKKWTYFVVTLEEILQLPLFFIIWSSRLLKLAMMNRLVAYQLAIVRRCVKQPLLCFFYSLLILDLKHIIHSMIRFIYSHHVFNL